MQTDLNYDYIQHLGGLYSRSASRYTGKERDGESGLDYFGARHYASMAGRFISPDWSGDPTPLPYATLTNPQTLGGCSQGMSISQLQSKYDAWTALGQKRAQYDNVCWNGGDLGHQKAEAQAWETVANCADLLANSQ